MTAYLIILLHVNDYRLWLYCLCQCAPYGGVRYVMRCGLIFRAAGAGGLQRAGKELGAGL